MVTSAANLPEPADDRRSRLRAGDTDRELVHALLSAAMSHGVLTPVEYSDRAGKALVAKTFGELDELTDDLPVTSLGVPIPGVSVESPSRVIPAAESQVVIRHRLAIMSGSELRGTVAVDDHLSATAIMGGVDIDLRSVRFTAPVLTIQCTAIMGGIEIIVPTDVTVEVGGIGIMGGFGGRNVVGPPGAPVVRVTGLALMGGVDVKARDKSRDKSRRRR